MASEKYTPSSDPKTHISRHISPLFEGENGVILLHKLAETAVAEREQKYSHLPPNLRKARARKDIGPAMRGLEQENRVVLGWAMLSCAHLQPALIFSSEESPTAAITEEHYDQLVRKWAPDHGGDHFEPVFINPEHVPFVLKRESMTPTHGSEPLTCAQTLITVRINALATVSRWQRDSHVIRVPGLKNDNSLHVEYANYETLEGCKRAAYVPLVGFWRSPGSDAYAADKREVLSYLNRALARTRNDERTFEVWAPGKILIAKSALALKHEREKGGHP